MENVGNKTFVELWSSLTMPERDKLSMALSRKCNAAIFTVGRWGVGYRTPKIRSQEIITAHLKAQGHEVDMKTLFPA